MGNFYDEWLGYWDDEQKERAQGRKSIQEEELDWVRTKQDYRAALLCSRQNGFVTAGDIMLGEIPQGWYTGKHSHGEEAIYIVEGEGCSVIDDKRYDWDKGSCLFIPFGAAHQHFNTGDKTVRYLSAASLAFERFAGLARVVQYEETGQIHLHKLEGIVKAESDIDPEYGRIVLKSKDALAIDDESEGERDKRTKESISEFHDSMAKEMKSPDVPRHRARAIALMQHPANQFKAREIQMTHVLCDKPGGHAGKHSHMEAVLYVLQGEGYSIIDEENLPWKKGTLLHVQGPQTVHQHWNTGQVESQQLRIHYGVRSHFFQAITKRVYPYLYYDFSSY